jgi:hypothetical protein
VTGKNLQEVIAAVGLPETSGTEQGDHQALATSLAERVAPEAGLGLALIGPLEDGATYVAAVGPDGLSHAERGRTFQDTDYVRRWVVIQGLDWVRRIALGQLESPADWAR